MNSEDLFIKATQRWYRYVNLDHHKDRDCHWFITEESVYSYGEPSEYVGFRLYHDGYILDDIDFVGETKDECFKQATEFIDNFIKNDESKTDSD